MHRDLLLILASLLALHAKHFLFDFVFQTAYQLRNKGKYGHPGGLLHAGLHAAGSIPGIVIWPAATWLIAALVASEFMIHYHMDWIKEQVVKKFGWSSHNFGFWVALGLDQLVHATTYICMVGVLATYVAV